MVGIDDIAVVRCVELAICHSSCDVSVHAVSDEMTGRARGRGRGRSRGSAAAETRRPGEPQRPPSSQQQQQQQLVGRGRGRASSATASQPPPPVKTAEVLATRLETCPYEAHLFAFAYT